MKSTATYMENFKIISFKLKISCSKNGAPKLMASTVNLVYLGNNFFPVTQTTFENDWFQKLILKMILNYSNENATSINE